MSIKVSQYSHNLIIAYLYLEIFDVLGLGKDKRVIEIGNVIFNIRFFIFCDYDS
jgi:hypothetical protein